MVSAYRYFIMFCHTLQTFDMFDVAGNGHIEFGVFVQVLSVFHPKTPVEVKITCKNYVMICDTDSMLSISFLLSSVEML